MVRKAKKKSNHACILRRKETEKGRKSRQGSELHALLSFPQCEAVWVGKRKKRKGDGEGGGTAAFELVVANMM